MGLFEALTQIASLPIRVVVDIVMIPHCAAHGQIPAQSTIDGFDKIRKELSKP